MRSTHTYVVLEISASAHAEIKAKLLAAGYQHAIDGETIDMHGIALQPDESQPAVDPEVIEIDSQGKISGTEESMARFRQFAANRYELLNGPFSIDERVFSRF